MKEEERGKKEEVDLFAREEYPESKPNNEDKHWISCLCEEVCFYYFFLLPPSFFLINQ
ncbi:MAG: hypothetical protein AAF757_22330 [Cyanobacteria bacterium P01_D01_bin.116]